MEYSHTIYDHQLRVKSQENTHYRAGTETEAFQSSVRNCIGKGIISG